MTTIKTATTNALPGAMAPHPAATLHFLCGKLAAGKTTLSHQLAGRHRAVLISEDIWLRRLYPVEIKTFDDYLVHSRRLREVVGPHVQQLLTCGQSVVLDFPMNVPAARAWVRSVFEGAGAGHLLHYVKASDEVCLRQLERRNRELPEGSVNISVEQFEAITRLFREPSPEEGFTIETYEAG